MFGSKKTKGITLNQDAHCSKCHKKIRSNTKYSVINGKLYCE